MARRQHDAERPAQALPLVGLSFHVFGEDGRVQQQGIVRGMVNDQHALVQYFDWASGVPTTLEVVPVARMSLGAAGSNRAAGSWQFYRDAEDMAEWLLGNPQRP